LHEIFRKGWQCKQMSDHQTLSVVSAETLYRDVSSNQGTVDHPCMTLYPAWVFLARQRMLTEGVHRIVIIISFYSR